MVCLHEIIQQQPSKGLLVPHTKSDWSALVSHYVIEGAIVRPALHRIAHVLFFLLHTHKGKWEGEIYGGKKNRYANFIQCVSCKPSHPHTTRQLWWPLHRGRKAGQGCSWCLSCMAVHKYTSAVQADLQSWSWCTAGRGWGCCPSGFRQGFFGWQRRKSGREERLVGNNEV